MTFIGFDSEYKEADIVCFGCPFDGTTSFRPGTRFAPDVIRMESYGLETYSPYMDKDLEKINVFDSGNIEMPFGNTEKALNLIENFSKQIVKENKKPLMIGGEHLVSLPVIKAVQEKYEDLCIIHFDAHTDLRDEYMDEGLSHATVIRRVWELVGDNRIFQFGIRSGQKEEFQWAKSHTKLNKFDFNGIENLKDIIGERPVYLTIDLDVLDPSIFSGTGTPEPGGVSFKELINALMHVRELNIVGADVVELSPHYDNSGVSTAVACKVIREVALIL